MTDNNFNYDSFVRNPPNPIDIDNLSLQDSLFSSTSPSLSPCNSFNISSFNINGLKMFSQNKIELLNDLFSLKNISFGSVVDTHLHPKQMHFLSKRLSNYTVFSSVLDTSQYVRSFGGVFLFIENSLASHVHTYSSLSSRLLSVNLYFKGHVKLCIFVVYIPFTSDQALRDDTIDFLIHALSEAKQLVTPSQWDDFSIHIDNLCNISPTIFASWHVNRMCEYLHANIIAGANAVLPARTVGNDHTLKLPKDLETLIQHYRFLNRVFHSVKLLRKYSHTLSFSHDRKWGLHLLKEKEFQDSSIKAHLESRDQNFDTDISSFINSALSRLRYRIVLDCVFIDHPTAPQLLTNPKDVSIAVINHFQHAVPIKSTPPSHISALLDRWRSVYSPMDTVSPDIYSSLLSPSSLEEWLSTVSSMPNGKVPGGNFAGLPRGTCRDPIITLESIIHDANHNNSSLWILSQDIFKAFDSVNLTMLKFALERIRLPASAITLILSLFMNRSNWIFTAYGETPSYQVRIGIDQGKVIFPLLWVIYIDPLLTILKTEMLDPYIL
ncbi:hypothetical protein RclHR1_12760009 [Rhizophagus clarus]|uniref:Reverse transcriptase domain-containing protein n=1 Tax=Rhizophagus clarus TaxID=94130 RepID=A0A2Z6QNL5_9GLOM|nr:hypothetical protein RclHR1_12760009 [Rhizophagus clarus]